MKQIKNTGGEILIKADGQTFVDPFHAYMALTLSLLKEPFMSSISKQFIISGSFSYLRDMGYSDEEMEFYVSKVQEIVDMNIVVNDFMG